MNPFSANYHMLLANLYLRYGRDEKMRYGNYRNAYNLLLKTMLFRPNDPDAYYHLCFILGKEERKWESSFFMQRKLYEMGYEEKRSKLRCHMALAYA
ncbi:MAG: hypothetical protein M3Z48_03125 [Lactobacillus sp.]|nr:hypothetical protein [Lactobacillus sp.]